MNGYYLPTQYIGALGTFPIYDVIDNTSNILNNYTTTTSNNLNQYITNVSNEISPVLFDLQDFQLSNPYAIMYRNSGHNNDTVIVERDSNSEILFKNHTLDCYSKIDVNAKLCVYHPLQALPAGYSAGWWDVEGRLTEAITLSQGLRFDVTNIQMDDLLQWTAIGTAQTTANSALALAGTANGVAGTALAATVVINGIIPTLFSSNSLNDINSFYMSSNLLNKQNYINSNSIIDDLSFYMSSNLLNKQNYINSNSIIDDLSFYISSNILNKQNYINSNSITDILSPYISNKGGGVIGGKFEFVDGKITIGLPKDATTITNGVDTYTLNPNSQLDVISNAYFAGNVGFGVTNPSYKLHFGNPFNGPTNSYQLSIDNDNFPRTGYRIANIYNGQQNSALKFINDINNAGGSSCTFWTRNPVDNTYNTRLTINSAGTATFEQEVISVKSFTCGANYFFNGNLNGKVEYSNIKNNPIPTLRFKIESYRFLYDAYTQCYYYDFFLNKYIFDNTINVGTVAYPIWALSRVFKIVSMNCFDFVHLDSINKTGNSPISFSEEITVYQTNIDPSINITDAGASPVASQAFNNYVIVGKKNNTNIGYWNFWTTNYGYMRYMSKQPLDLYFTITQIW